MQGQALDLTYEQLERLLRVVDSGKYRNWDWLDVWLEDGIKLNYFEYKGNDVPYTPENVLMLMEDDNYWVDNEWIGRR